MRKTIEAATRDRTGRVTRTAIEPLAEDPAYADALKLLEDLTKGLARIQGESHLLHIEAALLKGQGGPRAAALRAKHRLLQDVALAGLAPDLDAPAPTADGTHPAIAKALDLLKLGRPPKKSDYTDRVAELQDIAVIIGEAIRVQRQVVEELRSAASYAMAIRLQSRHRSLVLAHYRALQVVAAAFDELRYLRSEVLAAGYEFRSDLLPEPVSHASLVLGSEAEGSSEITRNRQLLEKLELLK